MSFSLLPVAKPFLLCDDVIANPTTGKPHIVNLWDTVTVPPTASWPFTLPKLCLFAWLRDGLGTTRFRFELVNLSTGKLAARPWTQSVQLRHPLDSLYAKFLLPNVEFASPGYDSIKVHWNGEIADDHCFRVHQPEGA